MEEQPHMSLFIDLETCQVAVLSVRSSFELGCCFLGETRRSSFDWMLFSIPTLSLCPQITQIQDLAIRCVQKNIKKNKGVKDWPWWKLFTTVRPLIEVQLTEDQIRGKDVRMIPLLEEERNNGFQVCV